MIRLLPHVRSQAPRLSVGFLALLLSVSLQMQIPLYLRKGVDLILAHAPLDAVVHVGWFVLGLMVAQGIGRFVSRYAIVSASRRIEYRLRQELWGYLLHQPPSFFDRMYTGDLMAILTNDLNAIRMAVGPALMYAAFSVISIVWALVWMVYIHPGLTVAILVPAAGTAVIMAWGVRQIRARFERVQGTFGRLSAVAQEVLTGIREVKAYDMEDLQTRRFEAMADTYVQAQTYLARVHNLMRPIIFALTGGAFLVLLGYGGWLIARDRLTVGTFVAFQAYLAMLAWPLMSVGWILNLWQRGRASWHRVQRLVTNFHIPSSITFNSFNQSMKSVGTPTVRGTLRVEGVVFGYDGIPVLQGVDLMVPAGAWVALVGPSAAGKSTLLKLLAGLYLPWSGAIRWDGRPIEAWPVEVLRRSVVLVLQEPVLFSRTIRENLTLGWTDPVPDERLWEVLAWVQLDKEVRAMPQGLDTLIGERGVTLSGGQRQRLALARALLRRPSVLLLDDPFSQVDVQTEQAIWSTLQARLRGICSLIIVTQRHRPVLDCDAVGVLQRGRMVAFGPLPTVQAQTPWFRQWLTLQRRYADRALWEAGS